MAKICQPRNKKKYDSWENPCLYAVESTIGQGFSDGTLQVLNVHDSHSTRATRKYCLCRTKKFGVCSQRFWKQDVVTKQWDRTTNCFRCETNYVPDRKSTRHILTKALYYNLLDQAWIVRDRLNYLAEAIHDGKHQCSLVPMLLKHGLADTHAGN